jgi:hypothetical protein
MVLLPASQGRRNVFIVEVLCCFLVHEIVLSELKVVVECLRATSVITPEQHKVPARDGRGFLAC